MLTHTQFLLSVKRIDSVSAHVGLHVLAEAGDGAEHPAALLAGRVAQVHVDVVEARLVEIERAIAKAADELAVAPNHPAGQRFAVFERHGRHVAQQQRVRVAAHRLRTFGARLLRLRACKKTRRHSPRGFSHVQSSGQMFKIVENTPFVLRHRFVANILKTGLKIIQI
jgi:hypothetical protein